jgi:hypothetical protein
MKANTRIALIIGGAIHRFDSVGWGVIASQPSRWAMASK